MVELIYMCVCVYIDVCAFDMRDDDDDCRGEERAEYNSLNIRQHRKIDEMRKKKQQAQEVKVEPTRANRREREGGREAKRD